MKKTLKPKSPDPDGIKSSVKLQLNSCTIKVGGEIQVIYKNNFYYISKVELLNGAITIWVYNHKKELVSSDIIPRLCFHFLLSNIDKLLELSAQASTQKTKRTLTWQYINQI